MRTTLGAIASSTGDCSFSPTIGSGNDHVQGLGFSSSWTASNQTGTGTGHSSGHYSVRVISASDNQESGRRLGARYGLDRILDGDSFAIVITG